MYYFMLGAMPLPIPPSALEIKTPSMNKTVNLINDGEINIPKEQGLREISFDFLLPTFQKYPFATYQLGNYTTATIILYLKIWKDTKYPIPFIVVRMSPTGKFLYFTSILCLIEDFTYTEDAEEYGFDTNCSINLKEYKPYGTRRMKLKQAQDGTKTASVKNTRSTDNRIRKVEIKSKDGETIVSAVKREGYTVNDFSQMKYDPIAAGEKIQYNTQDMMYGGSGYDPSFNNVKINTGSGIVIGDSNIQMLNSDMAMLKDITPADQSIFETMYNQQTMKIVPDISSNASKWDTLIKAGDIIKKGTNYITNPASAAKDTAKWASDQYIYGN